MARLIYSSIASLDGYVADSDGGFDWAAPDPAVHAFVNDLLRPVGTHLYGRRMYDVMAAWETLIDPAPEMMDFAQLWRAADKVVYSTTLTSVHSQRTRIVPAFDASSVGALVEQADHDVLIGGPGLAGQAMVAGLIDDIHVFTCPVVVGGGTPLLPDDVGLDLALVDLNRFNSGVVHLHYRVLPT